MKNIDLKTWKRRTHYLFYKEYDMPHFSLTANVDVTTLVQYSKDKHLSFFALMLYHVLKVVMNIEEFRYRIRGDLVVLHEVVHPSFTVLSDDNLVMFVPSRYDPNLKNFLEKVKMDIESARSGTELVEEYGRDDTIYITTIPWVSFTDLTHSFDSKSPDSIPRIAWGKYTEVNGKITIPLSITAHHSLCDGYHVGLFYQEFQKSVDSFAL